MKVQKFKKKCIYWFKIIILWFMSVNGDRWFCFRTSCSTEGVNHAYWTYWKDGEIDIVLALTRNGGGEFDTHVDGQLYTKVDGQRHRKDPVRFTGRVRPACVRPGHGLVPLYPRPCPLLYLFEPVLRLCCYHSVLSEPNTTFFQLDEKRTFCSLFVDVWRTV